MNKSGLRLCDVVEVRNGERYILIQGAFLNSDRAFLSVNDGSFLSLDRFSDDLKHTVYSDFDIMKFKRFGYSGDAFRELGMTKFSNGNTFIWEWLRKENVTYSARLVCVDDKNCKNFTKGKIYEVKKGILYGDSDYCSNPSDPFTSFGEIVYKMAPVFIELVED